MGQYGRLHSTLNGVNEFALTYVRFGYVECTHYTAYTILHTVQLTVGVADRRSLTVTHDVTVHRSQMTLTES